MVVEPTASAFWRLAGEAWASLLRGHPGTTVQLTSHGWLALSGEPVPDFNLVYVDEGPAAEEQLREFGQVIRERALPVLVLLARAVADQLAPTARELGLEYVGTLPLMVYQVEGAPTERPSSEPYQVEQVSGEEDLRAVHQLLVSAFGLPLDSIARFYAPSLLAVPDARIFLTRRLGQPISTVTTTGAGEIVGIWSMATPPEQQRQGAGRATLEAAMAYHRAQGTSIFYLGATEAGKPLYERTGFRTLEETPIWVAGHSVQFSGY